MGTPDGFAVGVDGEYELVVSRRRNVSHRLVGNKFSRRTHRGVLDFFFARLRQSLVRLGILFIRQRALSALAILRRTRTGLLGARLGVQDHAALLDLNLSVRVFLFLFVIVVVRHV